jgi:hypothetical protein
MPLRCPKQPDDLFMGYGSLLILNLPLTRAGLPTADRPLPPFGRNSVLVCNWMDTSRSDLIRKVVFSAYLVGFSGKTIALKHCRFSLVFEFDRLNAEELLEIVTQPQCHKLIVVS